MAFFSYRVKVDAPADRLWKLLLEKIRRPVLFVPGIVRVELVREFGEFAVERIMETDRGKVIHEIISADSVTKSVVFKYADDPVYSGYVLNIILEEDGTVYLEFALHWVEKDDAESAETESSWSDSIRNAVLNTKQLAETVK